MSLGCATLAPSTLAEEPGLQDQAVDIVVVHDVHEDTSSWTNAQTGINWLRDLLPKQIKTSRVITWSYDATVDSFFDDDAPDKVQRMAETLVQELRADRQLSGTLRRPIIFICHGLGGILVKKSLVYASTRTAPKVMHLWDQFVSTFAILFFGTPHGKTTKSNWLALETQARRSRMRRTISHASDHFRVSEGSHVQVSQLVDTEFSPLVKQFHMFFFWESLPTDLGARTGYIVDSESATPKIDNTEAAGIHANHSDMVKFSSLNSSDYRMVAAALTTYCEKAPSIISHRWRQAEIALKQLRAGEAWELSGFGFNVHSEETFRISDTKTQRYFFPPRGTSPHFIGRSTMLDTLETCFFPRRSANFESSRKTFIIYGMGGSGKTQLSAEFAHKFRDRYVAVFTLHAASSETIADSFCRIAQLAGLEPTENSGKHFIEQLKDPWLLIIDNADDPTRNLLDILPCNSAAHILVTTRNPDFREEGTLGFMELGGLGEDEALHLLFTKAGIVRPWTTTTVQSGKGITKALGCLALALIQAGSCIYRRICTVGEYLKLHAEARHALRRRRLSEASSGNGDDDTMIKVYSTFDLSLSHLMKRNSERSRDASDLLNILSCFHFERIPEEIFSRAAVNCSSPPRAHHSQFSVSGITQGILNRLEPPKLLPHFLKGASGSIDRYRINWAIAELQSHSLVTFDGRLLSMHPLVHAWARDRLSESEQTTWANIAFSTVMAAVRLPPAGKSETDGDFHRDVLPHLELCIRASGNQTPGLAASLGQGRLPLKLSQLLFPTKFLIIRDQTINLAKCGWIYAERGLFGKAAQYLSAVASILMQVQGEKSDKTLTAMLSLAGVHWGLDQIEEAIRLQRQVVSIQTASRGKSHEDTLRAMDQLGKSLWLNGAHDEALQLQRETAERMRIIAGPGHHKHNDTLNALDNLGVTLSAWRKFDEAAALHREVLNTRSKDLGDIHPETLNTKASLAMALLELGDLEEARSLMDQVHEARQLQLGKEHPWTLWALVYVVKIQIAQGELKQAEELLLWGVEAGKRSLHDTHAGVSMGRGELAKVYGRQGRFEEAEKLTLSTLEDIATSRGRSHPDYIYGEFKLTHLYIMQGNRQKAKDTCGQALERLDYRLTPGHPLVEDLEAIDKLLGNASMPWETLVAEIPGLYRNGNPTAREARKRASASGTEERNGAINRSSTW